MVSSCLSVINIQLKMIVLEILQRSMDQILRSINLETIIKSILLKLDCCVLFVCVCVFPDSIKVMGE